jgi:tetratricopeptide (TPR) repeat protein
MPAQPSSDKKPMHLIHKIVFAIFIPVIIICLGAMVWLYNMDKDLDAQLEGQQALYMSGLETEIMESKQESKNIQGVAKAENKPYTRRGHTEFGRKTLAGNYLISQFAQKHHDWAQANESLDLVITKSPENASYLKRAMILSMGSGNYDKSIKLAHQILDQEGDSALVSLFLIAEAIKKEDYKRADDLVDDLPGGSVSAFILPLLKGWSNAANGKFDVTGMNQNASHVYHAILIAIYMNKPDEIETLLQEAKKANNADAFDQERIGDIYAHIGQHDKALSIYESILVLRDDPEVQKKADDIKAGTHTSDFTPLTSIQEGIAETFYDMARALLSEYSEETARVFTQIALYLNPEFVNAELLLAHISARYERYTEAIEIYTSINQDHPAAPVAARKAADLYEEIEQNDKALKLLWQNFEAHKDIDSLIQIGDLHRRTEAFEDAVKAYDQAFKEIKNEDTLNADDFWNLYYAKGMSNERLGNWDEAESDLKKALELQPNHPYILNYLGYAWADKNVNLDQALEMIKQASALRPADGYITDSLGWIYYKRGKYPEALKHLERAVELLPYDAVVNDHLGDAYWKMGRRSEAKFQWKRALNYSEGQEDEFIRGLHIKVQSGLQDS